MRKITTVGIIQCFLAVWLISQHQNFSVRRITTQNGLSSNVINCLLQTKDGFLWIGTQAGLNRYDGTTFKVYYHNVNDSLSLTENDITALLEDHNGNLWIGTRGNGLCFLDRKKEIFFRYPHDDQNPNSPSDNDIQLLREDEHGILWFGTANGGLNKLNTKTMIFQHYLHGNISSICEEKGKNVLWLGSQENGNKNPGLIRFDIATESASFFPHKQQTASSIASDIIWNIVADNEGSLWLALNTGVDKFNLRTQTAVRYSEKILTGSVISRILLSSNKNIWIGTFNYRGLFHFEHTEDKSVCWLRSKSESEETISNDCIRCLYEDINGNIWIGTEDGLNEIQKTKPFKQYLYLPAIYPHRVSVVKTICEDRDSNLWIGYGGGGVDKIRLPAGTRDHFTTEPGNQKSLSDIDVEIVYEDKKGNIWIAVQRGGLNLYNKQKKSFTRFVHDPSKPATIRSNNIKSILEASTNNNADGMYLFLGTDKGTDVFDTEKKSFLRIEEFFRDTSSLLKRSLVLLHIDRNENYWFSEWAGGLYCYNRKTKKQNIFTRSPTTIQQSVHQKSHHFLKMRREHYG